MSNGRSPIISTSKYFDNNSDEFSKNVFENIYIQNEVPLNKNHKNVVLNYPNRCNPNNNQNFASENDFYNELIQILDKSD